MWIAEIVKHQPEERHPVMRIANGAIAQTFTPHKELITADDVADHYACIAKTEIERQQLRRAIYDAYKSVRQRG